MEIVNAKIKSTVLGVEGHGIPTCMLHLDYGNGGHDFGGYDLRHYGIDMLLGIMRAVGVETWEQLPGKFVRVKADYTHVKAIGHIVEDKWYEPEKSNP